MKTSLKVLCAASFLILVFSSCKKDPEDRLPGTWTLDHNVTYTELGEGSNAVLSKYRGYGTMTFNEDGTYEVDIPSNGSKGTWSSTSDVLTLTKEGGEPIEFEYLTYQKSFIYIEHKSAVDYEDQRATLQIQYHLTK